MELPLPCHECGALNPARQNFCGHCGASLVDSLLRDPLSAEPDRFAAGIHGRSNTEGERKQVTVLFADIKGSTTLIEGLDAEKALRRLDPALAAMRDAIHRYEGTVTRVQGDGLMALFGAPLAHEDHAIRGCHAALALQEAMSRLDDPELAIRVGLHSGEVVVRTIRSDLSIAYDAVGPTVHLASRMEQAAAPGMVWLTGTTRRLARGLMVTRPLGLLDVKGLRERIETFELVGTTPIRSRWEAGARSELAPLVGRDDEIERLRRVLLKAEGGEAQAVYLTGEPGVGKSRLIREFAGGTWTRGWRVLKTGSTSYSTDWPYMPIVELLEDYFAISAVSEAPPICEQVADRLNPALEDTLPALLALLDASPGDAAWKALAHTERRRLMHDAVTRLLESETEAHPLLLIFEDLHWADVATEELFEHLLQRVSRRRILLLISARPDHQPRWLEPGDVTTHLELPPLSVANADVLLRGLLGSTPDLEPLKRLLLRRIGGNPFFLEESVRSLQETGVLHGRPGAYRPTQALREVRVPATVEALLAVRIDRLPVAHKRLLQAAAVVGIDVPLSILSNVVELPEDKLQSRLTDLVAADFLVDPQEGDPDPKYGFRHALTHEVAYSGLLHDQRQALHVRVVEAIEQLPTGRIAEHAEVLAYHAVRCERWQSAATYLRIAGDRALARSANTAATSYFEEALGAISHLPEDRANLEQAIDLRLELRNSLLALGEPHRMLDYLNEAEGLAKALDDRARLARVSSHLAHCFWLIGDWNSAVDAGRRALNLAHDDFSAQVTTKFFVGLAHYSLGEYRKAVDSLARNVAVLRGGSASQRFGMFALPAVVSRSWLAWCLAELGEFHEGIAVAEEALQISEAHGQSFDLVQAKLGLGGLYLQQGKLELAVAALTDGVDVCRSAPVPILLPRTAGALGGALALAGRIDEALPLLEDALERALSMRLATMDCLCRRWLSEAYLLADRPAEAMRELVLALDQSRASRMIGLEAWLLHLMGKVHARSDHRKAASHMRDALSLAARLEMRPLQAHCHLALGPLLEQRGRFEEAQKEKDAAARLYALMHMQLWDRAEWHSNPVGGSQSVA
jgi:class 3 adenylate cyclase/tetratricopeptide (TPR) repeat protein